MKAEFLGTAEHPSHYPATELPEVAFAGRSNVGKSSLINQLVARRGLVRTSKAPGRTRQLGFFRADDRVVFVDLPGYGYAKVSKAERASWKPMVERYLADRRQLALVAVLIDCRREVREEERSFFEWLDLSKRPWLIVATKMDKLKRSERHRRLGAIASSSGVVDPKILPFSVLAKEGKKELWSEINASIKAWEAQKKSA